MNETVDEPSGKRARGIGLVEDGPARSGRDGTRREPVLQVGVDIGGTFTDFAVLDEATATVSTFKSPSTRPDPLDAVVHGLDSLELDLARVRRFLHGTTIGTNAVLERRGARTALITTAGFRDHIEIGDNLRYTGGLFDPHWQRTRPLVPIPLRFEVPERVLADGSVRTPLDPVAVERVAAELVDRAVESVAVCFVNSYRNPAHEEAVGEALARAAPGIEVSLSSRIVPEWREFPRFTTAVMNAYVQPLLRGYLDRLAAVLRERGFRGEALFMGSNAGLVSRTTATSVPVRLVLSGPAAGVVAGVGLGRATGFPDLITCDMGGTSTDVCLIQQLEPRVSSRRVLDAFPILTPMVDVNTVGAGGGSIVWVDPTGALRVGPSSAGSEPGPACYGRGGHDFTITDANLILGRLDPAGLGGGQIPLDRERAIDAALRLNGQAGFPDMVTLADAAVRIAVTSMCAAVREISVQRGHDPRSLALAPFGGAGPMHAIPIAEELGIPTIVVPPAPGNVCAAGLLASDLRHDLVRSHRGILADGDPSELEARLAELEREGRALLAREGVAARRMRIARALSLRYAGQSFELDVPLEGRRVRPAAVARDFDAVHLRTYGYDRAGHPLELVHLRVTAIGLLDHPAVTTAAQGPGGRAPAARVGARRVHLGDGVVSATVYDRARLRVDATVSGPAVIEEPGSVTLVFPGWRCRVSADGSLVLDRRSGR